MVTNTPSSEFAGNSVPDTCALVGVLITLILRGLIPPPMPDYQAVAARPGRPQTGVLLLLKEISLFS